MSGTVIEILLSVFVAASCAAVLLPLWPKVLPAVPEAGERGRRRAEALAAPGLFARIEPLVRGLGAALGALCPPRLEAKLEAKLEAAGYPLGLGSHELVSASALLGAAGLIAGTMLAKTADVGVGAGAVLGLVLGSALPWIKIDEAIRVRRLTAGRALPHVVDLIALSMEAGLDFTNAATHVAAEMRPGVALRFELLHLLHKLSLGWSRQDAIAELARRLPTPSVRQFAGAVIQAERRGTPLAGVLRIQADMMRMRRSQAAEQAASRAAVLILGPLMLIFACVFILLLGPFIVKYMRGELF